MKSLKDVLKNYRPSLYSLRNLLNDDDLVLSILSNAEYKDILISEAIILVLTSTKAGAALLQQYTKKINDLSSYDSIKKSIDDKCPNLAKQWDSDDHLLLKFFGVLVSNKNMTFAFGEDTNKVTPKTIQQYQDFKFLFNVSSNKETDYLPMKVYGSNGIGYLNLYVLMIWPKIESILLSSLNSAEQYNDIENSLFPALLKLYHRENAINLEYLNLIVILDVDYKVKNFIMHMVRAYNSTKLDEINQKYIPEDFIKDQKNILGTTTNVYDDITNTSASSEIDLMGQTAKRQETLKKISINSIKNSIPLEAYKMTSILFDKICALVDPLTQPIPNDQHIISLDLLYRMFLGIMTPHINLLIDEDVGQDWRYEICSSLQIIIASALMKLNCYDLEQLNDVDESKHWKEHLHLWLPHGLNPQNLELFYMICIFAVYTIHKLYDDKPLHFNPFLPTLISLWKRLTYIILYGLQVDRFEEDNESFNTPVMVRATIRGASALRSIVATVLNNQMDAKKHDFLHEPLNTYMSPHGRKLCNGALYADLKSYTATMLALGLEFSDITELLSYLQPGDRFDEDVKYMFEYEYDDYNEPEFEDIEEDDANKRAEEKMSYNFNRRRCKCVFSDDDILDQDEYYENNFEEDLLAELDINSELPKSDEDNIDYKKKAAIDNLDSKSKLSVEFDYNGKDWRDIPRGLNIFYSLDYAFISKPSSIVINNLLQEASQTLLTKEKGILLLRNVSSVVKNFQDSKILDQHHLPNDTKETNIELTPLDIYRTISETNLFDDILKVNRSLGCSLMDELLMTVGYRRVFIWYLTRRTLSHTIIYYIFELLMESRGEIASMEEEDNPTSFTFSRQGVLLLSEIEKEMLLQEFFTNATLFFSDVNVLFDSASTGDQKRDNDSDSEGCSYSMYAVGLMKITCIMVLSLIDHNKFDVSNSESVFELQTLLMGWINILPEAKNLFFRLKESIKSFSDLGNPELTSIDEASTISKKSILDGLSEQNHYNKKLLNLFPKKIPGEDGDILLKTFEGFLSNYSFDSKPPYIGRKVIQESDDILPLTDLEKPISLFEYFGNEPLYDVDVKFEYEKN